MFISRPVIAENTEERAHVGEIAHELEPKPQKTLETDVFDYNILPDSGQAFAEADSKNDLGVDPALELAGRKIHDIVRHVGHLHIHDYSMVIRVCECADEVDAWGLGTIG